MGKTSFSAHKETPKSSSSRRSMGACHASRIPETYNFWVHEERTPGLQDPREKDWEIQRRAAMTNWALQRASANSCKLTNNWRGAGMAGDLITELSNVDLYS